MNEQPELTIDDRVVMLLYRLTMDHEGTASLAEVKEFGVWTEPSIDTATALGWLREASSEETIEVTSDGYKALSRALAAGRTVTFGGSVPDEGPRLRTLRPQWENLGGLQEGLTREDYEAVLNAEEYEAVYDPIELGFPGLMYYSTTLDWGPTQNHPFAGRTIAPHGYPGKYIVAVVLHRQGAPDQPKTVQMDQRFLEGDSHLWLPEGFRGERNAEGQPQFLWIEDVSSDGEPIEYILVPNKWGRLGKIRTEIEAKSFADANNKAYKTLLPILCDLSYRYDMPLNILQVNTVELTTLTHTVEKMLDYREAILSEDPFDGGVDYAEFPLYSTFAYLYREGLNSSSIAYGFLCFYRIIEGIRKMREKRGDKGEYRRFDNEKVVGNMTRFFEEEFHGKKFGHVIDKMFPMRTKVAHAFLGGREGPEDEEFDSLEKRLELEAQLSSLRSQAREIVRVLMQNEYWAPRS